MTLTNSQLREIERRFDGGITSAELLDLFASAGIHLSEATLRKYVQFGLLPRSVRIGRKGKHRGSQGVYPISVVRQIVLIKEMMADNYTIEQLQRDFFFMRSDLQQLEQTLQKIFSVLSRVVLERGRRGYAEDITRDIEGARGLSEELVARLQAVEGRLTTRAQLQRVSAS